MSAAAVAGLSWGEGPKLEELLARLRLANERYSSVVRHVGRAGGRLELSLTAVRRRSNFGLLLAELARKGQLVSIVASHLEGTPNVGVRVREGRCDVLELSVSPSASNAEVDGLLQALEAALDALAHGRSDILLRHLTGKPRPDQIPYIQDEGVSEPPLADVDRVVSVTVHPRTFASLARRDTSLVGYDHEEATAVGRLMSAVLGPFVQDARSVTVNGKRLRLETTCLPRPKSEIIRDAGEKSSGIAAWLLQAVVAKVVTDGDLRGRSTAIEVLGGDHKTVELLERTVANAGKGPKVQLVVVAGAAPFRPAPDSVVIDPFGLSGLTPTLETLALNLVYVGGASLQLGDAELPAELELAAVEGALRSLEEDPRGEREELVATLAARHGLRVAGLQGFWGDIGSREWAAFFARREGTLPRYQPSAEVTAANPALSAWPEGAYNICDRIFCEAHLRSVSRIIDPVSGDSVSYLELLQLARRYAARVKSLHVARGEVVAFAAPDGLSGVALLLACCLGGWVFAPLNYTSSPSSFARMLEAVRPRLLLHEPAATARYAEELNGIPVHDLNSFLSGPAGASVEVQDFEAERLSSHTPAVILFTSGSTGTPKGVSHCHGDFEMCGQNFARFAIDLEPQDCVYTPSRIFFSYGLNNLMMALVAGASHVLATPLEGAGKKTVEVMRTHGVTVFFGVPTMFKLILSAHEGQIALPNLRVCVSAGEKLPGKLFREVGERLGVVVVDGIGNTEAISTFVSNRARYASPGCTGVVVPGFEVRLVNPRGELCGVGEVGTLWVKGSTLAPGYLGDPELTAQSFVDGWFNTQDMFYRDAEHRLYNVGRATSVIKINACWFSPEMMEMALLAHPAVKECAVSLVHDDYGLARPKAFVVLSSERAAPDIDSLWGELRALAKEKLGKDHYPHLFATIEALPRTCSGKLVRSALAKLA